MSNSKVESLRTLRSSAGQRGYSILEFIISLTIGLLLISVALSAFVLQGATSGAQGDISAAREVSRLAATHMARQIRTAGFRSWGESPLGIVAGIAVANGVDTNESDRIRVRYYGSGTGASGDGTIVDCLGAGLNGTTMVSIIYAVRSPNGAAGLYCSQDAGTTWTLLFPGVESMQVLLGSDTNNNGTVNAFAPATGVLTDVADSVRALDLSMVIRSSGTQNIASGAQTYVHFGANYVMGADTGASFTPANDGAFRIHERLQVGVRNRLD